ncbi:hypothetical protein HNY73_016165 [Argiope bruennichi]|uniref:Uncharacterized protein n=1 Tax=Argiope bruennichi TaxID=94029 RepID=A0A8T0ELC9_ARGBR|nr:hypothetical protein HNY73_016165 [Argiope bruennichi]
MISNIESNFQASLLYKAFFISDALLWRGKKIILLWTENMRIGWQLKIISFRCKNCEFFGPNLPEVFQDFLYRPDLTATHKIDSCE